MSIKKIPSRLLNTTVDVYRKSYSQSDVGDFNENSTTLLYSAVPASIQSKTSDMVYEAGGVTHYQTHAGYLNTTQSGIDLDIAVDDIIINTETHDTFTVIGLEKLIASNKNISSFHHFKLALESISGIRQMIVRTKTVTAKARIV